MKQDETGSVVEQAQRYYAQYFADATTEQLHTARRRTDAARETLLPLGECVAKGQFSTANAHFWAMGKVIAIRELLEQRRAAAQSGVQQNTQLRF